MKKLPFLYKRAMLKLSEKDEWKVKDARQKLCISFHIKKGEFKNLAKELNDAGLIRIRASLIHINKPNKARKLSIFEL